MADRDLSKRLEGLERLEPYSHPELGAQMRPCQTLGGFLRLSDVLNALQDVEGEGDNEQVAGEEVPEAVRALFDAIRPVDGSMPPDHAEIDALAQEAWPALRAWQRAAQREADSQPPGDGGQVEAAPTANWSEAWTLGSDTEQTTTSTIALRGPEIYGQQQVDVVPKQEAEQRIRVALSQPRAGEEGVVVSLSREGAVDAVKVLDRHAATHPQPFVGESREKLRAALKPESNEEQGRG